MSSSDRDKQEYQDYLDYQDYQKYLSTSKQPNPDGRAGEAFVEGLGEAASFGALPRIQSVVGKMLSDPAADANQKLQAQGFNIQEPKFSYGSREDFAKRGEELKKENPKSYLAGNVVGTLSTAAPIGGSVAGAGKIAKLAGATRAAGLLEGTGAAARLAQAGTGGALAGAAQDPGTEDVLNPRARLKQAGEGAVTGLLAQGAGEAAGSIGKGLASVGKTLKGASDSFALKQVGADKRAFKELYKKDKIDPLAKFIKDKGIIDGAPSPEAVYDRLDSVRQQSGQALNDIYQKLGDSATKIPPDRIVNKLLDRLSKSGARPKLGTEASKFDDAMVGVVQDIAAKGQDLSNPKALNDIIGELDSKIRYSKTINELPAIQQGLFEVRDTLRKQLKVLARATGKEIKEPGLLKAYEESNKDYGSSKQLLGLAENKVATTNMNRVFSLTDYQSAIGSGLLGAASGAAHGDNPVESFGKGLLYGAAGAVGNRAARKYGPGLLSGAGRRLEGAGKFSFTPPTASPAISGALGGAKAKPKKD